MTLSKINPQKTIDKKVYKKEMDELKERLAALQIQIRDLGIPLLITLDGFSAAGKGTLISKLLYPLDPRYFKVYTMAKISEAEGMRPYLWRFFTKTPSKGQISIIDKSWYRGILPEESPWNLTAKEQASFFDDISAFERQLRDDGVLILKLFLYISKDEQKSRFKSLAKDEATSWRINENDIKQNKDYEKYLKHYSSMIEKCKNAGLNWEIIEADDSNYAAVKAYHYVINKIEEEIKNKTESGVKHNVILKKEDSLQGYILDEINLSKTISDSEYFEKLENLQNKIKYLGLKLYAKRRPVVIVYEGFDAAGKGGNIKRLTQSLDPRGYEVVPVSAPTLEELDHHYLWRFWNKIPKDGHIAIYDRSWYGRVLVERIEGFAEEYEWQRAYEEINEFETQLLNHGTIIFKFWLQIDMNEQLKRFTERQNNPLKKYKITDEDWRNRNKWDLYKTAAGDMLNRTSTKNAPWTIIESNSKKFARIKTLDIVVKTLENELN